MYNVSLVVLGVNITNPEDGIPFTGTGGKCPAGFQCPQNSTFPKPCDPGTYASFEYTAECSICPDGGENYYYAN